jgi:hypothetical protein
MLGLLGLAWNSPAAPPAKSNGKTDSKAPAKVTAPAPDPFERLAEELTHGATSDGEKINIGVGNFAYENTDLLSPFSSFLREELEVALGKTGRTKVVTRDRIADLQMEGKFQNKELLEPGTGVEKVSVEGIKGIVRGRFYLSGDKITVYSELVWLEGGEVRKTRLTIPAQDVRARVFPEGAARGDLVQVVKPQNLEQSLANVQEIAANRLSTVPKDFGVQLFTVDGKRAYAAGETVAFRVRAERDCHVAVICHQSDGTSVVLFPNRWAGNTLVTAGKPMDVPGTHKSGFEIEIGPPYGSDVVEVLACSQPSELHRSLSKYAAQAETYQTLTRGMAAKGIQSAVGGSGSGALLWGRDSIVVSTFPKP